MALKSSQSPSGQLTYAGLGVSDTPAPLRPEARQALGLPALVAGLALGGALLWRVAGRPWEIGVPRPELTEILAALRAEGGRADFGGLVPWCFAAAWAFWNWLAISVVVQLLVAFLDAVTHGARWARALRRRVDACTATIARRCVTGATTWLLFITLLRPVSAGAAPVAAAPAITLELGEPLGTDGARPPLASYGDPAGPRIVGEGHAIEHIVGRGGESRWELAERYFGDGNAFRLIDEANRDRPMGDGRPYDGILSEGDRILIVGATQGFTTAGVPVATAPFNQADGNGGTDEDDRVVAEPGDYLRAIARRYLGDEARWPELRTLDGRPVREALANPDLIYPGQVFLLPNARPTPAPAPSPPPAPAPAATPLVVPDLAATVGPDGVAVVAVDRAADGTPLTITGVTDGAHGSVTPGPGGTLTYRPAPGFAGVDRFAVTVADQGGRTATATVAVTVPAAPVPLTVSPLTATTGPDGVATIAPPRADDGTPLTVVGAAQGNHGSVSVAADGTLTYRADDAFAGTDRFAVAVRDGRGRAATATVIVNVPSARSAPTPAPRATAPAQSASVTAPATAPTPSVVAPTASPTSSPRSAVNEPRPEDDRRDGHAIGGGELLLGGVGVLTAAAAVLAARRLLARNGAAAPAPLGWDDDPADDPAGFAPNDLAHAFAGRRYGHEVEQAPLLAAAVARFLREEGFADAAPLLAVYQRGKASVLVRAAPADIARLAAAVPALGRRLGGKAAASAPRGAADGDVELTLWNLKGESMIAMRTAAILTQLVPVAALPNGARVYANWDALGHILITGREAEGVETVLTSLLAELCGRSDPVARRLYAIARGNVLPERLLALPFFARERVDPGAVEPDPETGAESLAVDRLLAGFGDELEARRQGLADGAAPEDYPELVLVVADLADLRSASRHTLEQLGAEGPAHRIRLLAATARPELADDALLPHFATRLVLRLNDHAQSARLLGMVGAAELSDDAHLLLRLAGAKPRTIAGIEPGRLRGERTDPRDLAALADEIERHYAGAVVAGEATEESGDRAAGVAPLEGRCATTAVAPTTPLLLTHADAAVALDLAADDDTLDDENGADDGDEYAPPALDDYRHEYPEGDAGDMASEDDEGGVEGETWDAAWTGTVYMAGEGVEADHPRRPVPLLSAQRGTGRGNEDLDVGDSVSGDSPSTAAVSSLTPVSLESANRAMQGGQPHSNTAPPAPVVNADTCQQVPDLAALAPVPVAGTASGMNGNGSNGAHGVDEDGHGCGESAADGPRAANVAMLGDESRASEALPPPMSGPRLYVRAFGTYEVTLDGREITAGNRQMPWQMLALLAVSRPGSLNRDRVIDALWLAKDDPLDEDDLPPGDPDRLERQRKRVRKTMSDLRDLLTEQAAGAPRDLVGQFGGVYRLHPDLADSDVYEFLRCVDRATMRDTPLDEALALYERAGELLAGELLAGLPYEWLTPPGKLPLDEQYAGMLPKLRESLARRCAASGRPAQAAAFYEQILQDEPLKEEIVRQLMLCYAALGDRRGLRNAERNLRLAFRREWGNERDDIADTKYNPSPPTATLFARLDAELAARERENSAPVAEFPTGPRSSAHRGVTVASAHGGAGH